MKRIGFILLSLWSVFAAAKDVSYYRVHPVELQLVLKACSDSPKLDEKCNDLQIIAQQLNAQAYELQSNPQQFGQTILHLQEMIAKATIELENTPSKSEIRTFLEENTAQLQQRLAVVKWLESPN